MKDFCLSRFGFLISLLWIAACSTENFRYVPTENASESRHHRKEANYAEPSTSPTGKVRILSMGVVNIKQKNESETFPAIHIRFGISVQDGAKSWDFEASNQKIVFPNINDPVEPILVNSDSATLPHLTVKEGEQKSADLYYPLPSSERSPSEIQGFMLSWQIAAGDTLVRENTHFQREVLHHYIEEVYPYEPYPTYYPYEMGWGSVWWGGGGPGVPIRIHR